MKGFILGIVFIAALTYQASAVQVLCNQSSNVYWFGSGNDDCGNWLRIYGPAHEWSSPYGPIDDPPLTYGFPVSGNAISAIGTEGRFADGYIAPDFVAFKYGLSIAVAQNLDFIPPGFGVLYCGGIAGATANGNIHKNQQPNQGFDEVIGLGGYDSQVARFISLMNSPPAKPISSNDVFIYSSVFADDILAIASDYFESADDDNDGWDEVYNDIYQAGTATINNLATLADAGARQFIIGVVDPMTLQYIPALVKQDPCNEDLANLVNYLSTIMNDCLYNRIQAFSQEWGVSVSLFKFSDTLNNVYDNYQSIYGIRMPFCNDLDPRVQFCSAECADVPFPTFMDVYLATEGTQLLPTTLFFDDLHLTSSAAKLIYSQVIENYLAAYLIPCV